MSLRFVILTQYYPPETGAPQNRLSDLAGRLAAAGHEVTVLTAKPNYPRAEIHPEFRRGLWKERREGTVRVVHCWLYPSKSKRLVLRLLNYFSFVLSSAAIGALKLRRADYLIVESPPLFLGMTGWLLSRLERASMIFNVSDLYPETAVALGYLREGRMLNALFALERWCYRQSVLVTGQTEGIVDSIRRRFPEVPVHLWTNGIDVAQFARSVHGGRGDRFTIGYAGILGHAQALFSVLEGAALLHERGIHATFHLYGDGPLREELEQKVRALGLDNVVFAGHRTRAEILSAMEDWDAGLVPLVDTPLMAGALPSKMFEVMAAGLPVVLFTPEGEASRLVARAGGGVHAAAGDPEALAAAVERLAADREAAREMGQSARTHAMAHYDRGRIADSFLNRLEGMRNSDSGVRKERA